MYIHLYLLTCLKCCICIYKNGITINFDVTYICILGWWPCITNTNIVIVIIHVITNITNHPDKTSNNFSITTKTVGNNRFH